MRKIGVILVILLVFLVWGWSYMTGRSVSSLTQEVPKSFTALTQPVASPAAVDYQLELVAQNLFVPWSVVFTSADRMLVTERNGAVRIITNGQLQPTPLFRFQNISTKSEEGLMGMALDPQYTQNKLVYVCVAYPKNNGLVDKVVALKDNGQSATEERTIIDDIPAAQFHAGCRLKFGPDKKLYITTGDATNRELAQNKESLAGKILRLNPDGSIPSDNPFPNSPLYSIGHRNPQGIDWHPVTGTLYETEHGPSGFDGPGGGDEVNVIKAGQNYGWPKVSHEKSAAGLVSPKLTFTPAVAPAAGLFYKGDVFPQFKNNFFFGMLQGTGIHRLVLDEANPELILSHEDLPGLNIGRIREVTESPDGLIYFSTSNRDGRGNLNDGDDKIYRIVPVK
jgi:glucose/arabinose dehydrogenase